MRGMRTVAANTEIAGGAEHLAPDPALRTVDHNARIVAARCAREYGVRHQPGRGFHIIWIDRRGLELDQQIILAARQRVRLDDRRDRRGIGGLRRQADTAGLDRTTIWFGSRLHNVSGWPEHYWRRAKWQLDPMTSG